MPVCQAKLHSHYARVATVVFTASARSSLCSSLLHIIWDFNQSLLDFFNLVDSQLALLLTCESLNITISELHCWAVQLKAIVSWKNSHNWRRRPIDLSRQTRWTPTACVHVRCWMLCGLVLVMFGAHSWSFYEWRIGCLWPTDNFDVFCVFVSKAIVGN